MNDGQTNRIRVRIFGSEYVLRGDAPEEMLRSVAEYVDGMMRRITTANPRLDAQKAAVLAALNIAEELFRLRREANILQQEATRVRRENEELLRLLDELTRTAANQ
ncbi:hypothetical protein GCM10010885_14310 [Alicyclobacillus cellulosilyticus]|uniref:Cell division protein ZapA n=1 Tax=Alicyclobacillus cellulosilyticus TaxID=1003997 RepID=A0A917NK13_9BACL|nr:cell division protein ZapA [Alicyclobacillus cellulosilyticus]GGJ06305.1 hypothetical protein GCM10010885_14310 [Alicyclobacillus cellulosilyticus]